MYNLNMKKLFFVFLTFLFFQNLCAQAVNNSEFTASKASYFPDSSLNKNIYPVKIELTQIKEQVDSFKLYYSTEQDKNYILLNEQKGSKSYKYIHDSQSFIVGQKLYYKLECYNQKKLIKTYKDTGWGALNPVVYFTLYNKYIKISWDKLVLMNKPKNLDKLGDETIKGSLSGSLHYYTKISELSGIVTMDYFSYSDNKDFYFNGTMQTKANLFGKGDMTGSIDISGMYPGKVFYDNVKIKDNKTGGGTYGVFMKGHKRVEVNYTYIDMIYGENFRGL